MRALLWIATILMVLWSGYWFVGKSAVERGFVTALAQAEARGLQVEQAGFGVAGYPNRFDLTVTDPRVTEPARGLSWASPFVQVFSLSYKPWHVIAAFAPDQTITRGSEVIDLKSEKLQASLVVTPGSTLALDRVTLVGSGIAAASSLGWTLGARDLRAAVHADETRANSYAIGLEALEASPDPALAALLPDLPGIITSARVDATAELSAPIQIVPGGPAPVLTALSLREASLNWGELVVFAKGDLTVVAGLPEGRIDIRVEGWRNLVTMAVGMGLIKPEVAPTVTGMMQALAGASGGDGTALSMPLIFRDGMMSLGPLPLGPAPRLN